jgi:starch phosphorylase
LQHFLSSPIDADWQAPEQWARMSLLNTARMAWFSADRTIRDYATEIWQVPVPGRSGR